MCGIEATALRVFIVFKSRKGMLSIQKEKASTSIQFSASENTFIPLTSRRCTKLDIDSSLILHYSLTYLAAFSGSEYWSKLKSGILGLGS